MGISGAYKKRLKVVEAHPFFIPFHQNKVLFKNFNSFFLDFQKRFVFDSTDRLILENRALMNRIILGSTFFPTVPK